MTALATARAIREERWKYRQFTLKSGKIGYQGGGACLDTTTGKVVPAALGTALLYLGTFVDTVDATLGDVTTCNINLVDEITVIWFANGTSTDAVASTDIGKDCYFLDDQTVSILRTGKSLAGRVMAVDTTRGVAVQKASASSALSSNPTLTAYVSNDSIPTDIVNGALYDVPTTAAASTITLPAAAADGTVARFVADGTKNGHTVTYRDATGTVNLTTALTASKRHFVEVAKLGGKWFANAYVSP